MDHFLKNNATGETYFAKTKIELVYPFMDILNELFKDSSNVKSLIHMFFTGIQNYETINDYIPVRFKEDELEVVNFRLNNDIKLPAILELKADEIVRKFDTVKRDYAFKRGFYDFYVACNEKFQAIKLNPNSTQAEKDNFATEENFTKLLDLINRIHMHSLRRYYTYSDANSKELDLY